MTRERAHLLSISVEDYFHAPALRGVVGARHWSRLESRVERNTRAALDLLEAHGARASFLVLGWVAEELPEVVREIVARGHEVASKGHDPRELPQKPPEVLRDDLRRSRDAIERAAGTVVRGVRVGGMRPGDTWALDLIADEGFTWDSSTYPRWRSIAKEPWRRFPHVHAFEDKQLFEFPVSTWGSDSFLVPVSGGNYLRQLPTSWVQKTFAQWERHFEAPFHMYFHIWELDPELPRIFAAGRLARLRQYRNLGGMEAKLRTFLERYRFESVGARIDRLGLAPADARSAPDPARERIEVQSAVPAAPSEGRRTPLSIVIPCYQEESVLPYLARTLDELRETHGGRYDLSFVLVDDASRDRTWELLQRDFAPRPDCEVLRHDENRGVAAAILTGVRAARTELVASMDCDCSYDPHQLFEMVPRATEDVAVVTASPYHPLGSVLGVPGWRLFLSRGLSRLYGLVFRHKLATYTSCFRVYRRSQLEGLELRHGGFLGVVELLAEVDAEGRRIVEYPAVLESRLLGVSKMKTLKVIGAHLRFLAGRVLRGRRKGVVAAPTPAPRESEPDAAAEPTTPREPARRPQSVPASGSGSQER